MKIIVTGSLALGLLVACSGIGAAQILKQEPSSGTVPAGKVVLVDDGTCGPGKIKQITGGSNTPGNPIARSSKCIARK